MKKNELVDIIRTLVKEEVHNALPQLLMEVLAEKMTENSTSILESSKQTTAPAKRPNFNVQLDEPVKKQTSQPSKVYTKNPILNQVLNETIGGVPQEETTNSAVDVLNNLTPQQLNENKEVAAVASALKKDYRALLKAVDDKAKTKRR
jgi:PBP1b-binding outer membrane lipoprotein LpoB